MTHQRLVQPELYPLLLYKVLLATACTCTRMGSPCPSSLPVSAPHHRLRLMTADLEQQGSVACTQDPHVGQMHSHEVIHVPQCSMVHARKVPGAAGTIKPSISSDVLDALHMHVVVCHLGASTGLRTKPSRPQA